MENKRLENNELKAKENNNLIEERIAIALEKIAIHIQNLVYFSKQIHDKGIKLQSDEDHPIYVYFDNEIKITNDEYDPIHVNVSELD